MNFKRFREKLRELIGTVWDLETRVDGNSRLEHLDSIYFKELQKQLIEINNDSLSLQKKISKLLGEEE